MHQTIQTTPDISGGEGLTRGGKVRDHLSVGLCQLAPWQSDNRRWRDGTLKALAPRYGAHMEMLVNNGLNVKGAH